MKKQASAPATSRSISDDFKSRYMSLLRPTRFFRRPLMAESHYFTPHVPLVQGKEPSCRREICPNLRRQSTVLRSTAAAHLRKGELSPQPKRKNAHVMDNSDTRRSVRRP